ncbi:serine/arginine repetitive matrix protein 2-like [Tripterygium wilfordii]|uniref:Serine/arginine repetitive matrix protein 2-like n=1 Tax=Tripterygium wilfordii TaxID=458696 RepID=A0A7J7DPU3_TRIWF|nr:uncharacterized protein LOC119997995 [Tripterygium wilfordii]KAF5748365.1 serine/arginine repetitive matrix protein 2-like [Tripterygium wilfordii]
MSIAVDSNRRIDIEASGLARGGVACVPATAVFDSLDERREVNAAVEGEAEVCSSSSTSSIGQNSDLSARSGSEGEDGEENEVQSKYKGTLDSMEALEEVLPIRRGISNFYHGKSKSFTSLAEAASNSVKDIAKAENAYTRRRRNLLGFNLIWDNKRNGRGGISKRPISTSRSAVALAMALSSSESISNTSDDSNSSSYSRSPPRLPPLHPLTRASYGNLAVSSPPLPSPQHKKLSPWRSYSLADLQQSAPRMENTNSYGSLSSDERQ